MRVIKSRKQQQGFGVINWLINNLPFEAHLPGYQFCGPGTHLQQRLAEGQRGVNRLDKLCMLHDVAYEKNSDVQDRLKADQALESGAREIANDPSSRWTEKLAAKLVAKVMHVKQRFGA